MSNFIGFSKKLFERSPSLTTVSSAKPTKVVPHTFAYCTGLKSVNLPEVTTLGNYAFEGCTALATVIMPKVTYLEERVFIQCPNLDTVSLNNATGSIRESAFQNYTKLKNAVFPKVTSVGNAAFRQCTALTTVDLGSAETIGSTAFLGCTSLTTIDLSSVETIGNSTFHDCTSLTNVTLSNQFLSDTEEVTRVFGKTPWFDSRCHNVNGLKIYNNYIDVVGFYTVPTGDFVVPAGILKIIGMTVNSNFSGVSSLTLPVGLIKIGDYLCYSGVSLRSIVIPESVEYIGKQAFYYCYQATVPNNTINLPNCIKIGDYSFSYFSYYNTLSFDFGALEEIGTAPFQYTKIGSIIIRSYSLPATSGNPFASATVTAIYVRDELVDEYKATAPWSTYASKIKGISELPV